MINVVAYIATWLDSKCDESLTDFERRQFQDESPEHGVRIHQLPDWLGDVVQRKGDGHG